MKAETRELSTAPAFKPFVLEIVAETLEEAQELWHRFNCNLKHVFKSSTGYPQPQTDNSYCVWKAINQQLKKYGLHNEVSGR